MLCEAVRNMKYDYLIVGSGLYGTIFAHEAKRVDRYISMEHIFSVPITKRSGIMWISLWIFLSQETQIPVTWKLVFRSGNHLWLAWLKPIRNRTNVKPIAVLWGISRLYICEISCILHNCQSVSLSPVCMDTENGMFSLQSLNGSRIRQLQFIKNIID